MVYTLTKSDGERLDRNEGVPYAYTKEFLSIEFWPTDTGEIEDKIDINNTPEERDMLVYIDRKRIKDAEPKEEYIYRMNMGIADALKVGIPSSYVEKVMRKFIPELNGTEDAGVAIKAQKQAVDFKDEEQEVAVVNA